MAYLTLQELLLGMKDIPALDGILHIQANRALNSSTERPDFETTCTHCTKPASFRCSGCRNAPTFGDESSYIVYCNSVCQKADYANHKSICRGFPARKALFRVGDIFQESFYIFREILFDKRIIKIEEKDGKICFYEPMYNNEFKTRVDCLENFPSHLCKNDDIKKGILVFKTCMDGVGWMHPMIKYLLEDITIDIEERVFDIKNIKLKFAAIDPTGWEDPIDYSHNILKLSIKPRNEEYVIDLSNAQYGWKETVLPYYEFVATRMRRPIANTEESSTTFGTQREKLLTLSRQQNVAGSVLKVDSYASEALQSAVVQWEKEMKMKVKEIFQLPADDFKTAKEHLLMLVEKGLRKAIADVASTKTVQLPLPGGRWGFWGKKI